VNKNNRQLILFIILSSPVICWIIVVKKFETLTGNRLIALGQLIKLTPTKPILITAVLFGFALGGLICWLLGLFQKEIFSGAPFTDFLRGTSIVAPDQLSRLTRERDQQQITLANIPMPKRLECLHIMIAGSTGSGKSVLIREIAFSALLRGDRIIVADPNGEIYSKFGKAEDIILNPYEIRSQGWSFFNEIRHEYDFKRFSLSIVPRGQSNEEEEWCGYARLLLTETARKLKMIGEPCIKKLFEWTTIADPDDLKKFLKGTVAESLFVGATRALASARFVLSSKLPEHLTMPTGAFSLRSWLDDPAGRNLYITWREDMTESLKPLISAWIDILCTSILSLTEDPNRRVWLIIDELASLEKLASLINAATKGRKVGLRLVAGLQSTSQLTKIYGPAEAQTLRSCFRSLMVLGGTKTDPQTCEDMSKSLGEHEVEREVISQQQVKSSKSDNKQLIQMRERVVMPSEISNLPNLTGFLAFASDYPITRIKLNIVNFKTNLKPFIEKKGLTC